MTLRRSGRMFLGGALLVAGLLAGLSLARPAHAQIVICRDDPVVSLLNLGQLDLHSTISDQASDVKTIAYVVHVPQGTHVLGITNLDSLFGLRSTVKVYADNPPNTFDTYATVSTGHSGVAVTTSSVLVSVLNLTLGSESISGMSGQTLHIHFTPLL